MMFGVYFDFSNHMPLQNILNKCEAYIHTVIILLTAMNYITEFTADNKNKRPICHANFSMIHHKIRLHQYGACITFVVNGHALTTLLQHNSDYFITLI